ncbi:hypothetical protein, conserved [Leishmania tarentolae]|uniref:CNH domain-containing protein n=1 Tax=Leishmania tarentolae TaxID=5689 RepID=A0A640KE13_LEITA|nr:hypothetical protein, conserved [Leishmania tarentolae]
MPAVRRLLRLFDLDETDGKITALDSYGPNTHVGTSCGQLIRLSISSLPSTLSRDARSLFVEPEEATPFGPTAPSGEGGVIAPASVSVDESAIFTTVARRCCVSASGAAVQQLQHSRSQNVLFVLCGGRLQLLHADTYAVLSTIATEVASFSVAPPLPVAGPDVSGSVGGDKSALPTIGALSLAQACGRAGRLTVGDDDGANQQSRVTSHLHTPSECSYGTSSVRTLQSTCATPPAANPLDMNISKGDNLHQHHGNGHHRSRDGRGGAVPLLSSSSSSSGGKAHVVCVADVQKKELAVYVVDRVSTSASGGVRSMWSSTNELAEDDGLGCSATLSTATVRSSPPPRVVLRQRYVLPEPAQCVLMCSPAPSMRRGVALPSASSAGALTTDGVPLLAGSVEAGLSVCVGMRREVSLLSLIGGSTWCVLRLDGTHPPLLSVGSDYNTFLVRTHAPNTVMEVGVPPAAAMAGCVQDCDAVGKTSAAAAAGASPILLRAGTARGAAIISEATAAAARGAALRRKYDDLVMGNVFHADTAVQLVLARFPHMLLFTADHCEVVSLLEYGASVGANLRSQRVPLPGILYGAQRGQGSSVCVASDRTVWLLQLSPLRVQLAEMVTDGNSEAAFQLLAFHRRGTAAAARNAAAGADADDALRAVESDLHRMAGFAALHRGDVAEAIRYLRGHVDPREVLLALPDCIPPSAATPALQGSGSSSATVQQTSVDVYVLDHIVKVSSMDMYDELLRQSAASAGAEASAVQDTAGTTTSSYWDSWRGPCVYNSFGGNVAEAWRVAFAAGASSSSSTGTVEDFVTSRFDLLKAKVRAWFAEALLEPVGDARVLPRAAASPAAVGRTSIDRESMEGSGASLPSTAATTSLLPPPALLVCHRRAMEYASLVLAWEARDYRAAHQVVASISQALRVEDCADMLRHLREYRLLAMLQFRTGQGEACRAIIRNVVSVSAVLRRRYGHSAAQTTPVASQLNHWRSAWRR